MNLPRSLRVRFVRKPHSLEYLNHCARTPGWHDEAVAFIQDTRAMSNAEYDAFVANFSRAYKWLEGCGGKNYLNNWLVIKVTAPDRAALYINPEGYSYARYVGVEK